MVWDKHDEKEGRRVSESRTGFSLHPVSSSEAWEAFCSRQPGATAYHRWSWLDLMALAFGCRFLPLGLYQHGTLVGLAPLLVKQRGPYRSTNVLPFPYLGPLVADEILPHGLEVLNEYQRRERIGMSRMSFAPDARVDPDVLTRCGYTVKADATMRVLLEARSEEDLWFSLTTRGRRNVRKAWKSGVTIEPSTEDEVERVLPDIMREICTRRELTWPYPPSTTGLLWQRYHDDPDARLVTAHCDGEPAAVFVSLIQGKQAFNWSAAGRNRFQQDNPTSLLYWDAICWARGRGCAAIDLVGTVDAGLTEFKANFGAVETPYVVAEQVFARWVRWAREGRYKARALIWTVSRTLKKEPQGAHSPGDIESAAETMANRDTAEGQ